MKEAAMNRPHNRQLQQGGTGTRAQRLRSGATRVHGGEHLAALRLGGAALGGAVQSAQLLTCRPPRLFCLAGGKLADGAGSDARARGDVSLADA